MNWNVHKFVNFFLFSFLPLTRIANNGLRKLLFDLSKKKEVNQLIFFNWIIKQRLFSNFFASFMVFLGNIKKITMQGIRSTYKLPVQAILSTYESMCSWNAYMYYTYIQLEKYIYILVYIYTSVDNVYMHAFDQKAC